MDTKQTRDTSKRNEAMKQVIFCAKIKMVLNHCTCTRRKIQHKSESRNSREKYQLAVAPVAVIMREGEGTQRWI